MKIPLKLQMVWGNPRRRMMCWKEFWVKKSIPAGFGDNPSLSQRPSIFTLHPIAQRKKLKTLSVK